MNIENELISTQKALIENLKKEINRLILEVQELKRKALFSAEVLDRDLWEYVEDFGRSAINALNRIKIITVRNLLEIDSMTDLRKYKGIGANCAYSISKFMNRHKLTFKNGLPVKSK